MLTLQSSRIRGRITFLASTVLLLIANAFATTEKVVYSFIGAPDGDTPGAGLVADAAGNLFGTTQGGGSAACHCGTVFELSPPAVPGDAWTETVIYSFQGGNDGLPDGTLIFDKRGNLYGAASGECCGVTGSVFELSPPTTPGGAWTETVLWAADANNENSGGLPVGELALDPDGNLYGIDATGGYKAFYGAAYELIPPKTSGGNWTKRVLHYFEGADADPEAGMLLRDGVLYGTTLGGVVFSLVRKPGLWTETTLADVGPVGSTTGLIADSAGNLYGTVTRGGSYLRGTVFELSPPAVSGDSWQLTTLYSFTNTNDGQFPTSALWRDKSGDLFGITAQYGKGGGSVFKLKPPASPGGAWTYVFVYGFPPKNQNAQFPSSELILLNGALYGATSAGGAAGHGTVYSIAP